MNRFALAHDLNAPAFWAAVTTVVWFASGMVPLQIAVSAQLGLQAAQASSWIFIVWLSAALSSIFLSLFYRQPIPITWTIPGLIFLGTLAGQYTFAELVRALNSRSRLESSLAGDFRAGVIDSGDCIVLS